MVADPERLLAAIENLIEANAALTKRRALSRLERRLTQALRRAFQAQGQAFLGRLERLRDRVTPTTLREAIEEADWGPLFDQAALETLQLFQEPLDEFTRQALEAGALSLIAELDLDLSFTLEHPRSVEYLQRRGAERVTLINETTRRYLRTLLTQAAQEGWSYDRIARAIRERYAEFAGPPLRVRPRHIRSRAHAIAVYELGDAYEHGNMLVAADLQAAGLRMEKAWLTVGDDRVRPEHRANQQQGWIPLDEQFSSGHQRPPTDPGCRCTLLMRRRPE